jgi:hypothetical protein
MDNKILNRTVRFIIAYVGSLISILAIFLATMIVHYQDIDYEYLIYAALRMLVISIAPGILGIIASRLGKILVFLIGVVTGPLVAAVFIATTLK